MLAVAFTPSPYDLDDEVVGITGEAIDRRLGADEDILFVELQPMFGL